MFSMSPVAHLDKVKAPILFFIGDQDKRVPLTQGLAYYQLLRARGIRTRVLMFPGTFP